MSILSKLASNLTDSKKQKQTDMARTLLTVATSPNAPTQIHWQCRHCGRRTSTWSNSSNPPAVGICDARRKVNGRPLPHEWHKVR